MTPAAPYANATSSMGWFSRTEAWLDSKGKGAWIAAMVLGFVFFWPVGLAFVFYMTVNNKWSKTMFGRNCAHRSSRRRHMARAYSSSGNSAFDAYKDDTLRRLEDEQQNFEAFLQRLRDAKDKSEFDDFMEDRAKAAAAPREDEHENEKEDA